MAVKIRLALKGRHESPFYRIVVADSRYARDGRYLEQLGTYDPSKGIGSANINKELAIKWINNGAQYSDTLKAIFTAKGIIVKAKEEKAKNTVKKAKVAYTKSPVAKKEAPAKKVAAKKTTKKAVKKEEPKVETAKEGE